MVATASVGRTVLVVTALSEERQAVISFLRDLKPGRDQNNHSILTGEYVSSGSEQAWRIVLPAPTRAGNVKAATRTALNMALRPDLTFFVGVAGGFPDKVNMFDVVVADRVFHVEPAKIDVDGSYIPRPDEHKVTEMLLSRAQTLQDFGGWQRLLGAEVPNEPLQVWIEPIAAGEKLVACSSSEEFARIQRSAPRAVAVENEGFGVLQAAHEVGATALVIRGISDLIDNRSAAPLSGHGDADTRAEPDHEKLKAARHAAAFMFGILELLDQEGTEELHQAESEYVLVKLRWGDLQDLARGKALTLEMANGVPIFDLSTRRGSVEVEFRTMKLFAAFLYAVSLERDIFDRLVDHRPDEVDTIIDTSDPDIRRVFRGVRLLSSTDPSQRKLGEETLTDLIAGYPLLSGFASRVLSLARERSGMPPEDGTVPLLDFGDENVKDFIRRAKERGYVTMNELNDRLPTYEVTTGQIEDTLEMLSEMGVNVVEDEVGLEPSPLRLDFYISASALDCVSYIAKKLNFTRAQTLRYILDSEVLNGISGSLRKTLESRRFQTRSRRVSAVVRDQLAEKIVNLSAEFQVVPSAVAKMIVDDGAHKQQARLGFTNRLPRRGRTGGRPS